MVYKLEDVKQKTAVLTVDFHFDHDDVNCKKAIEQIDNLVGLADNVDSIKFVGHTFEFWSTNPYLAEEE